MLSASHLAQINLLRLLQLADSALPVGGTAHSFGLESLVHFKHLTPDQLAAFLADYLEEVGALESYFCRAAHRLAASETPEPFVTAWLALNAQLSALKPARESRAASAMLGRRLLILLAKLEVGELAPLALARSQQAGAEAHYSVAFGLAAGALGLAVDSMVVAYLQQTLTGLVSACQRLLPLGQSEAARLLWRLKPAIVAAAERSRDQEAFGEPPPCFAPLLELGSMGHPTLPTRLFMS